MGRIEPHRMQDYGIRGFVLQEEARQGWDASQEFVLNFGAGETDGKTGSLIPHAQLF